MHMLGFTNQYLSIAGVPSFEEHNDENDDMGSSAQREQEGLTGIMEALFHIQVKSRLLDPSIYAARSR